MLILNTTVWKATKSNNSLGCRKRNNMGPDEFNITRLYIALKSNFIEPSRTTARTNIAAPYELRDYNNLRKIYVSDVRLYCKCVRKHAKE